MHKHLTDMQLVLRIESLIQIQMTNKPTSKLWMEASKQLAPLYAEMNVRYPNAAALPADVLEVTKRF